MTVISSDLDATDTRLIRCLQLSPRVPFRTIAQVLDISEQTAARRYRRLVRLGHLRVLGVVRATAFGQQNWLVRVQVRPSGAEALGRALAQRDDVSWVSLGSGGSEVTCTLRARNERDRDELVMQRLPRTAPVLGMSMAMVLHRFVDGIRNPVDDWSGLSDVLTTEQTEAMTATWDYDIPRDDPRFDLSPTDLALTEALEVDGRATYSALAATTGLSESQVARRLRALLEGGALYFDVDMSVDQLGLNTLASLWLTVTPATLDAAGRALAQAREVAFAAAITGPQNLQASVVCRDPDHLYRFVTDTVGALPGVQAMELVPTLHNLKQAGTVLP